MCIKINEKVSKRNGKYKRSSPSQIERDTGCQQSHIQTGTGCHQSQIERYRVPAVTDREIQGASSHR
jgi:hypothetical protein